MKSLIIKTIVTAITETVINELSGIIRNKEKVQKSVYETLLNRETKQEVPEDIPVKRIKNTDSSDTTLNSPIQLSIFDDLPEDMGGDHTADEDNISTDGKDCQIAKELLDVNSIVYDSFTTPVKKNCTFMYQEEFDEIKRLAKAYKNTYPFIGKKDVALLTSKHLDYSRSPDFIYRLILGSHRKYTKIYGEI